jgi:hypothetical protein
MVREAQLNKIELANRFTRAVAVDSPRDFIFAVQEDQQVAESCNRLIKNAIACWISKCASGPPNPPHTPK